MKYFVVIKFTDHPLNTSKGTRIWSCYDRNHVWGSPAYEVLGFADTFSQARKIAKRGIAA